MKYQIILQHNEEDCGAACLATIAKHHGRTFTIGRVREAVGTGQLGTTLLGLRRGAELLGFNARQVKASSELLNRINEAPLPAIIHWKGYHWVVLYGYFRKKYVIADPAIGIRYISYEELKDSWTGGIMLLLVPDEKRFSTLNNDQIAGVNRFFKPILSYRFLVTEVTIINITIGLLYLALPFFIQTLTDDVLIREDNQMLTGIAIAVTLLTVIATTLDWIQTNLIAHVSQRLELGLTLDFVRQILRLPMNYFETRRSGEIISRLQDIQMINQFVAQIVVGLVSQIFTVLVSLVLMIVYSWQLSLLAIIFTFCMFISSLIWWRSLQQKTRSLYSIGSEHHGVLIETFRGATTLKTTNSAPQLWEEFQARFGNLANLNFSTTQLNIANSIIARMISGLSNVTILWFGGNLVLNQQLSIGQLLAFVSMNRNLVLLALRSVDLIDEFVRVKVIAQRLSEVIDATPENGEDHKPFTNIPTDLDIICANLTFAHPGRQELLSNLSVTIPGGKVTIIMGYSGSGKSTLTKLIAGIYLPQKGNIRFGIYNQSDLSLECIRQQVVLVPQEAHFWSRSIIANFQLSNPHLSFEEIVRACQIAEADEFISKLPNQYQTILGEFGANISGGQKQRLALARAIASQPPILILDESTGALDPPLETKVLDQLLSMREGKTTIMITHRPRVIERGEWIIMLENGQVKIQGTLEELKKTPGEHCYFFT